MSDIEPLKDRCPRAGTEVLLDIALLLFGGLIGWSIIAAIGYVAFKAGSLVAKAIFG